VSYATRAVLIAARATAGASGRGHCRVSSAKPTCARCGEPIHPEDDWHLDHNGKRVPAQPYKEMPYKWSQRWFDDPPIGTHRLRPRTRHLHGQRRLAAAGRRALSSPLPPPCYVGPVKLTRAREFIEAVTAHDFEAAERLLDPDVETVTPRSTLRGIAACRQVLQKASGDEQFALEQVQPELEELEGDVIARTHETARWRETGEVAYERDFAVRLTLDDERIVRDVVMPGGDAALATQ
jgi:ketosteroid isomerase-like protein